MAAGNRQGCVLVSRRYKCSPSYIQRDVRPALLKINFFYLRRFMSSVTLCDTDISLVYLPIHMDSPPSKSPGRNEFRDEGVARWWSAVSKFDWGAPHNVDDGHSWLLLLLPPDDELHVSDVVCREPALTAEFCMGLPWLLPPLRGQLLLFDELCWLSCCSNVCTSFSAGDSANMVVLPSTQLFNAPCACVIRITNNGIESVSSM